jgi:regulator of sirC expression with transglutaminase-like and TPR domain
MLRKGTIFVLLLLLQTGCSFEREQRLINQVESILKQPEHKIDVAKAKLTIDKVIDPSININASLKEIDSISLRIKELAGDEAIGTANITKFLYTKGDWNDNKIYDYYDQDKDVTSDIKASLLPTYLNTKRGNCVAMPVLHYALASKLGLEVYLTHVPGHILFKHKDQHGNLSNIEATDFGRVNDDVFYIKHMAITDKAIQNGIYLRPLTKRETVSVLLTKLTVFYAKKKEYEKAIAMSDMSLKYFPGFVTPLVQKAEVIAKIYSRELEKAKEQKIEPDKKYLESLDQQYGNLYNRAKELGWQKKPKSYSEKLLEMLTAKLKEKRKEK